MATNNTPGPSKLQVAIAHSANGMGSNSSSTLSSLPLGGTVMARADVLAKLTAFFLLFRAIALAQQAYLGALVPRWAREAAAVVCASGILPPAPPKDASRTTKAMAQARAAVTRQGRGAIRKKRRGAITATLHPSLRVPGPDGQGLEAATAPLASATPASPTGPARNPVAPLKS